MGRLTKAELVRLAGELDVSVESAASQRLGAPGLGRLPGIRLLTLEAHVVVHGDDRDGSGTIVLSPARPGDRALDPAGPARRVPLERPAQPGGRAGSDLLARAVHLADEGAGTLARTRPAQYRG